MVTRWGGVWVGCVDSVTGQCAVCALQYAEVQSGACNEVPVRRTLYAGKGKEALDTERSVCARAAAKLAQIASVHVCEADAAACMPCCPCARAHLLHVDAVADDDVGVGGGGEDADGGAQGLHAAQRQAWGDREQGQGA